MSQRLAGEHGHGGSSGGSGGLGREEGGHSRRGSFLPVVATELRRDPIVPRQGR